MKQTFYPLCLALGLLATACSSDSPTLPDNQPENALKTPITFSSGVAGGSVGRVVTGGTGFTYNAFTENTGIVMNIVSQQGEADTYRSTRTVAKTQTSSSIENNITFESNDVRYWDDAFGRSAKMSVYAVAVPGNALDAGSGTTKLINTSLTGFTGTEGTWQEVSINSTITWTVSTNQTTATINDEDLVYSNNVQKASESEDKRIGFPLVWAFLCDIVICLRRNHTHSWIMWLNVG